MKKERPIIFSGDMVRAILEGRKTVTRRIVKPQPKFNATNCTSADMENPPVWYDYWQFGGGQTQRIKSPFVKGRRLWVRETWADVNTENGPAILYKALGAESTPRYHFCSEDAFPVEYERYPACKFTMWCGDLLRGEEGHAWRSPIFMPRWASRITLEITNVRVERLQDITEADAIAEGFQSDGDFTASQNLAILWEEINGKRASWESNPWVWVIEFKQLN